jgi:hypothetical protein
MSGLTILDRSVLAHVADDAVSWRDDCRGRRSYRYWRSENAYIIVTRTARRLVAAGLVSEFRAAGYKFATRGGVELTAAGRTALTDA